MNIYSNPQSPNGWHQKLMMTMIELLSVNQSLDI